jgi:ATP/maltotriose-dependent transcriptional regulator MalT
MRESHMNAEAVAYFDKALQVAAGVEDMGYPFLTKLAVLENLIVLKRDSEAQRLADEILAQALRSRRPQVQAILMTLKAQIAIRRGDSAKAIQVLQHVTELSESGGFVRDLAEAHNFFLASVKCLNHAVLLFLVFSCITPTMPRNRNLLYLPFSL